MSKNKKLGLGILIGAAVGVVAGLLTAPKSGKETRKDIKKKAKEVQVSVEKKLKEAHKELSKLSEQAKKKAGELTGKAKDELEDLSKKADELKVKIKAAITSVKSGDDEDDDVTVDNLLKDFEKLSKKIAEKVKGIKA